MFWYRRPQPLSERKLSFEIITPSLMDPSVRSTTPQSFISEPFASSSESSLPSPTPRKSPARSYENRHPSARPMVSHGPRAITMYEAYELQSVKILNSLSPNRNLLSGAAKPCSNSGAGVLADRGSFITPYSDERYRSKSTLSVDKSWLPAVPIEAAQSTSTLLCSPDPRLPFSRSTDSTTEYDPSSPHINEPTPPPKTSKRTRKHIPPPLRLNDPSPTVVLCSPPYKPYSPSTPETAKPIIPSLKERRLRQLNKLVRTLGEEIPPQLLDPIDGRHRRIISDSQYVITPVCTKVQSREIWLDLSPVTAVPVTPKRSSPRHEDLSKASLQIPRLYTRRYSTDSVARDTLAAQLSPITFTIPSTPVPTDYDAFKVRIEDYDRSDPLSHDDNMSLSAKPFQSTTSLPLPEDPNSQHYYSLMVPRADTPFMDVVDSVGNNYLSPYYESDKDQVKRKERRQGWSGEWNKPDIQNIIEQLRKLK